LHGLEFLAFLEECILETVADADSVFETTEKIFLVVLEYQSLLFGGGVFEGDAVELWVDAGGVGGVVVHGLFY
jgi:hypothetical protein